MPSPSSRSPSSRLARAAAAERLALQRERDKLTRHHADVAEQLEALAQQLADVDERLELIDRLVPEAANVHRLPARGGSGGQGIGGARGSGDTGGRADSGGRTDSGGGERAAAGSTGAAAGAAGGAAGGAWSDAERGAAGLKGAAIRQAAIEVLVARPDGSPGEIHYRAWFDALEAAGHRVAGKDPLAVFLTQISRSPVVRRGSQSGVYELDLEAPAKLRSRLDRLHARLTERTAVPGSAEERAERDRVVAEMAVAERALDEAERALPARARAADDRRAAG